MVWFTIDRLGSMGRADREIQAHVAPYPELLEATLVEWAPQARIRLVLTTTAAVGQPAQLLTAIVVRLARPVSERVAEEGNGTPLEGSFGQTLADGGVQAGMVVGHHPFDPVQAAGSGASRSSFQLERLSRLAISGARIWRRPSCFARRSDAPWPGRIGRRQRSPRPSSSLILSRFSGVPASKGPAYE